MTDELLQQVIDLLNSSYALQSDFFAQLLTYVSFVTYVILPMALILSFGYWFFKQFYSRW